MLSLGEPRANMSTMGLHCRVAWAAQRCIVTSWVPPVTLWVLRLSSLLSSCPVSSASQQLSEPGYPTSLSHGTVSLRWPRASSSCCPPWTTGCGRAALSVLHSPPSPASHLSSGPLGLPLPQLGSTEQGLRELIVSCWGLSHLQSSGPQFLL